jgi:hypothetical protein
LGPFASDLGQYSCVKLLREMKAIESEPEDELQVVSHEDVEMTELPEELRSVLSKNVGNRNLPSDLYVLPDMMITDQDGDGIKIIEVVAMGQEKKTKSKWGPILVESWPTRVPRDGRTIMEKARNER